MSIYAMAWALDLDHSVVRSPTARHVLLCLCNYAHDDGTSIFPSIKTLSKQTGLTGRAIRLQLRALEKAGVLAADDPTILNAKIKRADRRPRAYRIVCTGGTSFRSLAAEREERRSATGGTSFPLREEPRSANPSYSDPSTEPLDGIGRVKVVPFVLPSLKSLGLTPERARLEWGLDFSESADG